MRKKNQEITDKQTIEEIIKKSDVCRIAMFDEDFPYIIPFNFGYKNDCLYIHTAKEGKKIELLIKNNKVGFEIEQKAEILKNEIACKWSTKYRSIIGTGKVEIINDFEQKKLALEIIMNHYDKNKTHFFEDKQINAISILKVNIISLTAKNSSNWNK